jgi:hypothetical protein
MVIKILLSFHSFREKSLKEDIFFLKVSKENNQEIIACKEGAFQHTANVQVLYEIKKY